jgi:branched-chain amino acid transport system substrate-binding protein
VTTLRATLVTPLTGPLARFGAAGAVALRLWATHASGLPGPWTAVDLEVFDAHPSAAAAMRAATLRRPDLIFGPYGSGPAVAALSATRRPVWNHGGATTRLQRPQFTHVLNVLAPATTYFAGALRAIHVADPAVHRVSLLCSTTGFGREVAAGATATSPVLGLAVQTTTYAPGKVEEAAATLPTGDVLLVAASFEDELAAARLLLARPWRAAAFVGAGVDDVLAPLGSAREGLLGPAQWMARVAEAPEEGPDAAWFAAAYQGEAGAPPPYPAAAAFAAGVLAARCLRETGTTADAAVLDAAARLSVRTLFGRFALHPATGLQLGHEVLTVQWQQGVRRVVWPPDKAERPLVHLRR